MLRRQMTSQSSWTTSKNTRSFVSAGVPSSAASSTWQPACNRCRPCKPPRGFSPLPSPPAPPPLHHLRYMFAFGSRPPLTCCSVLQAHALCSLSFTCFLPQIPSAGTPCSVVCSMVLARILRAQLLLVLLFTSGGQCQHPPPPLFPSSLAAPQMLFSATRACCMLCAHLSVTGSLPQNCNETSAAGRTCLLPQCLV